MRRLFIAALAVSLLAGCATATEPEPQTVEAKPQISADDIASMGDGIEWARGLDSSVTAPELSEGIGKVGDYFVDEDVWFTTNNEIGQDLISLNLDVLNDPESAGAKVDDLNLIVDRIEEAIAHGDNP